MNDQESDQTPVQPEVVEDAEPSGVLHPTKIIRIASMTRAMLEEVRAAPLDEAGRKRLLSVHERSLDELRDVLSPDLQEEFNEIFIPISSADPSEAELRIAQAQLVGWLEGLFHGIQASLWSQQIVAQSQLAEITSKGMLERGDKDDEQGYGGIYL